ncbi:S9 family peptidase [bacterium]|nr:S9 family peptidase [bacterium]
MTTRRAGLMLLGCLAGCAHQASPLQENFYEVARPRWNRNGDLAYLSDESGSWRAHVMLKAGGSSRIVPLANVTLAAWDPRRATLALQYDPDGTESFQLSEWSPQNGQIRPLAVKPGAVHHFGTFSRTGHLAFSQNERSPADFDLQLDGAPSQSLKGYNVPVRFAPDGRKLLYYNQPSTLEQQLFEIDLASGRRQQLTPADGHSLYLDAAYQGRSRLWMLSNLGSDYLGLVEWRRGGGFHSLWRCQADIEDWAYDRKSGMLALAVNQQGYSSLQFDPPQKLQGLPAGVYTQLGFRSDGSLTLQVDGPTQPSSVWQVWPALGKVQRLLGQQALASPLVWPIPVRFKAADGIELGGLLSWPERPRAGLVVLHGGPANQARPTFSPLYVNLARRGVAVLQLDVRGSTGYGRRFASLDDGPGRLQAVGDVQAGAEYLRSRGIQRLALMGHSYGGYLAWLSAEQHPESWSCLVVGSAISDPPAYFKTTAAWRVENRRAEYGLGLDPRLSPITQVNRLKMPVFLYHGRHDSRVPFAQGQLMAEALKAQGTRLEWLEFSDEGHHLLGPANRRLLAERVDQFLQSGLGL